MASVYRHLAFGARASPQRQSMTTHDQTIFLLSCKRSLDKVTRRTYVHGVGEREHKHMRIISDIFDALAAAAIVGGVICLAIAFNP